MHDGCILLIYPDCLCLKALIGVKKPKAGCAGCRVIKDAGRERRHDFMANDSRANITMGSREDNQVELS